MTLFLILFGVFLNAAAQFLLKLGMQKIGHFDLAAANVWPVALQMAGSVPLWGGFVCYAVSILIWLVVLSRVDVSVAYPMVSLGYVITALAAWWWLGEQMGPMRVAGIAVILIGVFMVSKTA